MGRAAFIISRADLTTFFNVRLPSDSTLDPLSDEGVSLMSLGPRSICSAGDGFGILRRRGMASWDEDMLRRRMDWT